MKEVHLLFTIGTLWDLSGFEEEVDRKEFQKSWLILGIGYAGLIQTHVLTCEITVFMTILLCVLYLRRIFVFQRFLQLVKGALLALGLSMWYLVPFLIII